MRLVDDDITLIEASPLLDAEWYFRRYPEVAELDISVAEHYVRLGASLLRDPGPAFSTRYYQDAHADVAPSGLNPLVHYLLVGQGEGRRCTPLVEDAPVEDVLSKPSPYVAPADIHRDMEVLRGSPLFDPAYYLETNPDVSKRGMDPLLHFVKYGSREGRQPNPWFSILQYRAAYQVPDDTTNPLIHYLDNPDNGTLKTSTHFDGAFYTSRYGDAARSLQTPLEHFLRKGLPEGRQAVFVTPAHARVAHIVDCRRVHTTIVVPVHNALAATLDCIQSVRQHTPLGETNRLLIIDDASTDPAVGKALQRFSGLDGIRVERNPSNLGYTRTINRGCELAGNEDVVLLNSDTVVGPHWLRNLKVAAYRGERTGTVTAVSNNAGAFSVPRQGSNDLPEGMDVDVVARILGACHLGEPFEVPTGNGFCMYVKRALLDDIGAFDAANFPVGYGEENEFCMRALAAGWCHRVEPSTYVGHVRSASFGERRQQLAEAGMERLRQLCPGYDGAVRGMRSSRNFQTARFRIARELEQWTAKGRKPGPRILFVISTRVGGTPQTNADLMNALAGNHECLALWCNRHVVEVLAVDGTDYRTLQSYSLSQPIHFATHVSGEYDDVVRSILVDWGIELLHIRHLAWHSLNLVDVARSLDVPAIHSFHDFYAICPSVTLIDEDGVYHPTGVTGKVRNPLWRKDPTDTGITETMLRQWQQRMQRVLAQCAAFVTTSQSAKDILTHALPVLAAREADFHVIPHGRDFERFPQLADTSVIGPDEPLRILLPGNIGLQKGMELIRQVKRLDVDGKLEFHLLGKCDPSLTDCIIDHGTYQRSQFEAKVAGIRPHIAAILSIGPETWCHTLTECWACGLPVVGIDLGAVGERLRGCGGGWLVGDASDPDALFRMLLEIRQDQNGRLDAISKVKSWQQGKGLDDSTACMADGYASVYRSVLVGAVRAMQTGAGAVPP